MSGPQLSDAATSSSAAPCSNASALSGPVSASTLAKGVATVALRMRSRSAGWASTILRSRRASTDDEPLPSRQVQERAAAEVEQLVADDARFDRCGLLRLVAGVAVRLGRGRAGGGHGQQRLQAARPDGQAGRGGQ